MISDHAWRWLLISLLWLCKVDLYTKRLNLANGTCSHEEANCLISDKAAVLRDFHRPATVGVNLDSTHDES